MATKSIAWNDGSGDYITLTYTGQGDGTVAVTSQPNNSANARSATFDIKTAAGSPVVTRELTVTQGACPVPIGTVLNYAYTGSYQEVTLPAGQYKLQCWGARGGSNATASSYSITAKAGGEGGYSEGVITLSSPTTVRVYVGGAGTSSKGGFNGGGSTSGSSTYSSGGEYGTSRMGGGGGATDIRLSDGALLSRMIVAGGGSGGAMCYQKKTTSTPVWESFASGGNVIELYYNNYYYKRSDYIYPTVGHTYRVKISYTLGSDQAVKIAYIHYEGDTVGSRSTTIYNDTWCTFTYTSGYQYISVRINGSRDGTGKRPPDFTYTIEEQTSTSTSTTTDNDSHVGYVGGGTNGGGYNSSFYGKQNAAGTGGDFGQGANQTATNHRYCSGAGGGGWYGGGRYYTDGNKASCKYSGGGSGWVNTAANASYRPRGYTGLELDSGETKAGNTSFPNTAGTGNETGHSGNGYAKITRLA